jgi:hypothetical protein
MVLLISAVLSPTSFADATPQNGHTLSDADIKAIVERILSTLNSTSSPVHVAVQEWVATLSGTMPSCGFCIFLHVESRYGTTSRNDSPHVGRLCPETARTANKRSH